VHRPRWFTAIDPDDAIVARARSFADALHATARVDELVFAPVKEGSLPVPVPA
jgi:hypothetical protein